MLKLRIIGARLLLAIVLSPFAGGLWMLGELWLPGIHPLDRWYSVCVYGIIGAITGTIVGLIWGLIAAFDAPAHVNSPAPNPDAPADAN